MKENSKFKTCRRVPLPYRLVRRLHYGAGLAILFALAGSAAIFALLAPCGQAMENVASNGSVASAGPGHVFYVSVDGNDNNDGSSGHPWATIQHAADLVAAGDM